MGFARNYIKQIIGADLICLCVTLCLKQQVDVTEGVVAGGGIGGGGGGERATETEEEEKIHYWIDPLHSRRDMPCTSKCTQR